MEESTHGLNCPNCGGVVPIPEGQVIVHCPYCDLRSFVRGERGLLRYQAPLRIQRDEAINAMRKFFGSNWAIARNLRKEASLSEAFIVHLPFWAVWARVAAWVFGEEKVGRGDDARYKPREIRVVQDMTWNGAACDVGEFGVNQVPPVGEHLEPFDPDELHRSGMVFEPVSSFSEARQTAQEQFKAQVQGKANLDRLAQTVHTQPETTLWPVISPPVGAALPVPGARLPGSGGRLLRQGAVWQGSRQHPLQGRRAGVGHGLRCLPGCHHTCVNPGRWRGRGQLFLRPRPVCRRPGYHVRLIPRLPLR